VMIEGNIKSRRATKQEFSCVGSPHGPNPVFSLHGLNPPATARSATLAPHALTSMLNEKSRADAKLHRPR